MADVAYSIESQNQTRANVGGSLQDVYEVHYAGPNGITGWIRIPTRTATPEAVDELIRRQLDDQLRIAALGAS